jgi:hypothetical protein
VIFTGRSGTPAAFRTCATSVSSRMSFAGLDDSGFDVSPAVLTTRKPEF